MGGIHMKQKPLKVSGKFYTIADVNHVLSMSYEIEVEQGIVTKITPLQKAEDSTPISVGRCTHGLWQQHRKQTVEGIFS